MAIKVGVIGLGMMGLTHLDAYAKLGGDVEVIAIADLLPERLTGKVKAAGNIEGQAQGGIDFNAIKYKYPEGNDVIKNKHVDVVDICLQTPLHFEYAKMALKKGKHVISEKPMCRTYKDAKSLAAIAGKSKGNFMVAQCMRFWPGWTWAKQTIDSGVYGKLLGAKFRRVADHPGGDFYRSGERAGGAALDLHIHDTDFVNFLFGVPDAVSSVGYTKITGETDHIVTQYIYKNGPMVVAEGAWCMAKGFGFHMQYTLNFERATADFNLDNKDVFKVTEEGKAPAAVALEPGMGYDHEIAYFIDCVKTGKKPTVITAEQAADSVRIVEAEVKSVKTGKTVKVK